MNRKTALVYIRVSRLDREDRDLLERNGSEAKLRALSPTTQLEQVKALPQLAGLEIEVFEDLHRSGKTTRRPGLERLRARLNGPDIACVAAWSISRLGRSVADLYALLEEMQRAGVAFVSAKEAIDTSTAYGRAFVGILAVLAQFERELTSERISANWQQAAASGRLIGAVPYGYRRVNGEVSIDEPAAELVRLIFRQYATGRYSYHELAEWLNAHGHRPPNVDGHHNNGRAPARIFVADMLKYLLRNERYVGRVVYKPRRIRAEGSTDRIVPALFPAIINEETWQKCAGVREKNAAHNGIRYSRRARYALTGLLRCRRCGSTVHGITTSGRYGYYVCRSRYGSGACSQPLARAGDLEDEMRDWLKAIRLPEGFAEAFALEIRKRRDEPKATGAHSREKALERRLARLRDLYEMGDLTRQKYRARRDELEAVLAEVGRVAEAAPQKASETIESLVHDWPQMDAGQKRQVLETIFSEVMLDGGRLTCATPQPGWLPYIERVLAGAQFVTGGDGGNRTRGGGFADLCLSTWLRRRDATNASECAAAPATAAFARRDRPPRGRPIQQYRACAQAGRIAGASAFMNAAAAAHTVTTRCRMVSAGFSRFVKPAFGLVKPVPAANAPDGVIRL